MEDNNISSSEYRSDEERQADRAQRRALMKKRKRRQQIFRKTVIFLLPSLLIVSLVVWGITLINKAKNIATMSGNELVLQDKLSEDEAVLETEGGGTSQTLDEVAGSVESIAMNPEEADAEQTPETDNPDTDGMAEVGFLRDMGPYAYEYSDEKDIFFPGYQTNGLSEAAAISEENVLSSYAILIDADTGRVIASRNGDTRINPASMTKIMTVLIAAERVSDLKDKVSVSQEIANYVYSHDCSAVNFSVGEVITVEDLMYGTILPSGADAALTLAEYVAGSEEEFVKLMNDKLKGLGLSDTAHFTNCIGLYDENHYCTLDDMAMIMKAAVENELAKEVLTIHRYTTSITEQNPEGIALSNLFLRRIEDKDTHGEVICAKTGFVNESGCCAASYEISNSGKHYICVTADAWSAWRCIYDHVGIYTEFVN